MAYHKFTTLNGGFQVAIKRKLNWQAGPKDHRDKLYALHGSIPHLPSMIDLAPKMSPIRDQGELGSCVGESSNAAVEFVERKDGQDPSFMGSPLFCYYNARIDKNQDEGAQIRDSVKQMSKLGNSPESVWPYDAKKVFVKPSDDSYKHALGHKISDYLRLDNLIEIKQALASGFPVLIGFTCFDSLDSDECAKTGVVPLPTDESYIVGGHAICLVGYDDSKKLLKFKNSWGESWGDKGYGYLPYGYIPKLADDYWVVRK